jgi:hypothetical protein
MYTEKIMEKRAKRAKREQKNSRIEKNIEDFLKDWHIKEKRKKRLEELTNNIKK